MAAATEWLNALDAGAEVVSVRRREPARRPLNVDRQLFTKRGLAALPRRAASASERRCSAASPSRPIRPAAAGTSRSSRPRARAASASSRELNGAEQVICATGLQTAGSSTTRSSPGSSPSTSLETEERWIVLADDSTVPGLTDSTRTLSLAGVPGQWAFPAADTLVGMKVAARGFRQRIERCPTR